MKLYVLRPNGHGEPTLIVSAESQEAALVAFMESLRWPEVARARHLYGEGYYAIEIYKPGEVAENEND